MADIEPRSGPDLMNDPQYATNTGGGEDGTSDADTCRICRGEATELEQLFYPCKCSGSIKFVHQDCLMEWLSHSQKKHCELCKTPFRFTKLYSPNMPQALPAYVFARHLIIYALKNMAIWLRFSLVVFVWLGCLPWAMRHIWGFLFWFGDGGWSSKDLDSLLPHDAPLPQVLELPHQQLAHLLANGTSPLTQTFNMSSSDSATPGFFKSLMHSIGLHGTSPTGAFNNIINTTQILVSNRSATAGRSSLLGDVHFLKTLTQHPQINGIIVTTLEGQIITVVVVICFILVFLIREWVVQQQPGINMGAGFNADLAGPDRPARNRELQIDNQPDVERFHADRIPRDIIDQEAGGRRGGEAAGRPAVRPIARPRRRIILFEDGQDNDPDHENGGERVEENAPLTTERFREDSGEGSSSNARDQRRGMSVSDGQTSNMQIQQHVAGNDSSEMQDKSDAAEFVSLWRRTGGNPEEVLRIIETEGLGEKLQYWKNAMKGLQHRDLTLASPLNDRPSSSGTGSIYSGSNRLTIQPSEGENPTDDSWIDIPEQANVRYPLSSDLLHLDRSTSEASSSRKGKEKLTGPALEASLDLTRPSPSRTDMLGMRQEPTEEDSPWKPTANSWDATPFQSSPGRPRSISDAPKLQENISPLASNNWSFLDLSSPSPVAKTFGVTPNPVEQPRNAAHDIGIRQALMKGHTSHTVLQAGSSNFALPAETPDTDPQESNGPVEIYNAEKGTTQHYQSWDEVFASNTVSGSADDIEETTAQEDVPEQNPLHPGDVLPENAAIMEVREPIPAPRPEPQGLLGRVADWLWGDMNMRQEGRAIGDEHVVQDIAAEAPFVPVVHHGHGIFDDDDSDAGGEVDQDPQVVAAALAAGIDPNDPDGLDDAEDFEGIMELVGMRGPLTALIQNGLFSIFLISLTVACGVWVPYNVGRLALLLLANPIATVKLPLKLVFSCAAVVQDLTLVFLGFISFLFLKLCLLPRALYSYTADGPAISKMFMDPGIAWDCMRIAYTAGERILDGLFNILVHIPESEVPAFSAVSHESLIHIKALISNTFRYIGASVTTLLANPVAESRYSIDIAATYAAFLNLGNQIGQALIALPAALATAESWVITLDMPERSTPLDPNLSYWSGMDRFWAIVTGYVAFSFLGAAYLRKGSTFSTSQAGKEWEAAIIDVLHQAGGVMKVILIISIEMLVFPLYCGLLLDLALLPLFDNATILSRVIFTIDTPLTSIFIHWFVGTCYMFHFALFVSMCRKIMRSGVLYFIRDPDDPTFHPVRDVLERNVATQLRKITFSAMVYGALVVICLGGVVWSLAFTFKGVLPIHWSSNEPVLEFPIDLLFYNFFMPLAVKFFKPSDGLHTMYRWWFRKCARMLRLTSFLFDERIMDEEGRFIRKGLLHFLWGVTRETANPTKPEENTDVNAHFVPDGRYVRAPASDQVRIPKGAAVFLEVTEYNDRIDGLQDQDDDLHSRNSELFKLVYVPPNFRLRIFVFILSIWIFAAVTGVSITIVPLVFGRHIFARIIPVHVRKNDVYAFSIGIYILGSTLYCVMHFQQGLDYLREALAIDASTPAKVMRRVSSVGLRVLRILYAYAAFAIVLPILFALAVEFYFIVPLHTYFAVEEPHIIHFVQSWTLGLLYVKLTTRFILWHSGSRPAEALRTITRNGYLDPDIRVATRAFIFPATIVLLAALLAPLALASVANRYSFFGVDPARQIIVYRYVYPLCLSFVLNMTAFWLFLGVMKGWRVRIRDEVYLIGERLHNFGDRNKSSTASLMPTGARLET